MGRGSSTSGARPRKQGAAAVRLWWVEIDTGRSVPLFDDSFLSGEGGVFSADGRWIAFSSPDLEAVRLYNTNDGQTIDLLSRTGTTPVWGGDGELFFTNFTLREEALLTHIYRYDLETKEFADLSGGEAYVTDGSMAWSAEAGWLAFTRRPARVPLGGEVWLMRPDGSEAHSLTATLAGHSGAPAWSADGRALLFQRFQVDRPGAVPEIWLYDLPTGETRLVAPHGSQPAWLP